MWPGRHSRPDACGFSRSAIAAEFPLYLGRIKRTPASALRRAHSRNNQPPYAVEPSAGFWGGRGVDKDDQKFIAVEGLHTWAAAILTQVDRLELARRQLVEGSRSRREYLCERPFLLIAARKLIDYIDWARDLGFLDDTIFKQMLRLRDDIVDLKVANEHVIEHYQGRGCQAAHWVFADELIVVDA